MRAPNCIERAFLVALAAMSFSVPSAAEECLTDWGLAGEIVRREKLLTVQQLTQSNAVGLPGQVIKTTLCKDGDDYVYKVVVRQPSGQLKTIVVDARSPGSRGASPAAGGAPPAAAGQPAKPR